MPRNLFWAKMRNPKSLVFAISGSTALNTPPTAKNSCIVQHGSVHFREENRRTLAYNRLITVFCWPFNSLDDFMEADNELIKQINCNEFWSSPPQPKFPTSLASDDLWRSHHVCCSLRSGIDFCLSLPQGRKSGNCWAVTSGFHGRKITRFSEIACIWNFLNYFLEALTTLSFIRSRSSECRQP